MTEDQAKEVGETAAKGPGPLGKGIWIGVVVLAVLAIVNAVLLAYNFSAANEAPSYIRVCDVCGYVIEGADGPVAHYESTGHNVFHYESA
ncbi:MAG: hypothetical protein HFJ66_09785 [Eggerthellaceae bacterium]|nr:hypothetical protein [Eggerthellaceae bacterium]